MLRIFRREVACGPIEPPYRSVRCCGPEGLVNQVAVGSQTTPPPPTDAVEAASLRVDAAMRMLNDSRDLRCLQRPCGDGCRKAAGVTTTNVVDLTQ